MTRHRWLGACLLGLSVVVAARADDAGPPRHVLLPPPAGGADPDQLLKDRFTQLALDEAKSKSKLTEAQIAAIQDWVLKNQDGARDSKKVNELIGKVLGRELTPKDQATIQTLLDHALPPKSTDAPRSDPEHPTTTANPNPPRGPNAIDPSPARPNPTLEEDEQAKEDLAQFARQLDSMFGGMPDVPAFQDMLRDITVPKPGSEGDGMSRRKLRTPSAK